MSHTPTELQLKAMAVLIGAPQSQVFRAQLVYQYAKEQRFNDATELLINAARAEIGSEWSSHCMQLAELCYAKCDTNNQPRKTLIAALLGLHGVRHNLPAIDVNAAVYLAAVHLDRGHSAARALAEAKQALKLATSPLHPA
jgi:hypothetical protein